MTTLVQRPPINLNRTALSLTMLAGLLAACSSGAPRTPAPQAQLRSFDEPRHGQRPRAPIVASRIPKGGGHNKVGSPYQINGRWYFPRVEPGYDRRGIASWYGHDFHGRKTANGEIYDMTALSAAHPTLPLPSYVWVTNEANGRTLLLRVNDRGPYANDRILDLSRTAARALGSETQGLTRVRVRYAGPAPLNGDDRREWAYLRSQPWYSGVATLSQPSSGRALAGPKSAALLPLR